VADITVFGEYTYLATEVAWGAVALVLLWYADAFRAAARTIVVLYPFAFLWDWYTLEVGVFAIPLRTGVELLGIPIEEHIFMVVVPAMVVGTHESLRKRFGPATDEEETHTSPQSPRDHSPSGDDAETAGDAHE
jgi:lycopene cyclase domain-containing protein